MRVSDVPLSLQFAPEFRDLFLCGLSLAQESPGPLHAELCVPAGTRQRQVAEGMHSRVGEIGGDGHPACRAPVCEKTESQRAVIAALVLVSVVVFVQNVLDADIEVDVEGGIRVEADRETVDQITEARIRTIRAEVTLRRMVQPIAVSETPALPFGGQHRINAELIGELRLFELGIDRDACGELACPV